MSFFLASVAPSSFCWTPPLLVMAVCAPLALLLSSFPGPATVSSTGLPDLHDVLQLLPQRLHPVVQVALREAPVLFHPLHLGHRSALHRLHVRLGVLPVHPCLYDLLQAVLLPDALLGQVPVLHAGDEGHPLEVVASDPHLVRPAQVLLVLDHRQELHEGLVALVQLHHVYDRPVLVDDLEQGLLGLLHDLLVGVGGLGQDLPPCVGLHRLEPYPHLLFPELCQLRAGRALQEVHLLPVLLDPEEAHLALRLLAPVQELLVPLQLVPAQVAGR